MHFRPWQRTTTARLVLRLLPFLYSVSVKATTYYVSPDGNDLNSGTTQAQAWKSITRVNQLSYSLQPGDQVLFQRGGTYHGSLNISSNGTSSQPIVVGAYGSGARPIITGGKAISGWNNYQGNIWMATCAEPVKYVFVNDDLMTLARYPNSGWLQNDNGSSTTLSDAALTQPNGYWAGARAVIRTSNWSYHTPTISAFNNGTLNYPTTYYDLAGWNWGYFLCNKLSELDAPGEWYYDDASDLLYLWAPGNANPNSLVVEAAVLGTGVYLGWGRHHITVQNVDVRHCTDAAIKLDGNDHVTVSNCRIEESFNAFRTVGQDNTYSGNTIVRTYGNGAFFMDDNAVIENNTFTDIAMEAGLGEEGWGYFGIRTTGTGAEVRANRLTNVGYIGIASGQDALIEKNILDNCMAITNDGSAIAFDNSNGMVIQDNIIRTVVGDLTSSASNSPFYEPYGHGIYFGNTSLQNTTVQRNTVTGCSGHGVHVDHTMISTGNQVKDNLLYGNRVQLCLSDYSNVMTPGGSAPYYVATFNNVVTGNTLYCTAQDQLCMLQYNCYGSAPVDFGTLNNNRYLNPYNELSIHYINTSSGQQQYFTLEEWQADRNEDPASARSAFRFNGVEATAELGPNTIANGTFDTHANGWTIFPGNAQVSHDFTYLDAGAMKAHIPNNSLYNDLIINGPDQFPIQSSQWYRIRLSTQSNVLGQLNVRIKGQTQMTGPYATFEHKVPFGPQRRDLELFFQSTLSDQALVQLVNNWTDPTYWIDNLEVHRVSVSAIDPIDQQILLINDQAATATMNLVGCYVDLNGAYHSGSIDVAAYTGMVLVKVDDALCGMTTGAGEVVASAGGTPAAPYPNPVEQGGMLMPGGTVDPAARLTLTDLQGRNVIIDAPMRGAGWAMPNDVPGGVYTAVIATNDARNTHRIVVR